MNPKKNIDDIRKEEVIQLIKRQTDYDRETIVKKLKKWDNNYLYVIKEYINPNFKVEKKKKKIVSNNQTVFNEIRTFMDDVNYKYNRRKKENQLRKERQQQLYINFLKQKKEKERKAKIEKLEPISENTLKNKIIEKKENITVENNKKENITDEGFEIINL